MVSDDDFGAAGGGGGGKCAERVVEALWRAMFAGRADVLTGADAFCALFGAELAVLRALEDVALPKATVNKFANDIASGLDVRLTGDTRELIAECCTEFVQLLSSEANDICEKDKKKTITPEHVLRALQQLGLEAYHKDVADEFTRVKTEEKTRGRAASKRDRNKGKLIDNEELLRQQEQLFAMARSDPMASSAHIEDPPPPS